jgi:hypothetical protein
VLAVLAYVGDESAAVNIILVFYKPTGPLSGVTTTAILIWLFAWGILECAGGTERSPWGGSAPLLSHFSA